MILFYFLVIFKNNPVVIQVVIHLINIQHVRSGFMYFQIERYNMLLEQIRQQLSDLEKGIKGLVVMSSDLEEIFQCIYDARVPSSWEKVAIDKLDLIFIL